MKLSRRDSFLLFFLLLLLSIYAVGSIHFNYFLPFHSEEFDHIALTNELTAGKNLSGNKLLIGNNWEIGFHAWLKSLSLASGIDPLWFPLFLPSFVALVLSLSAFVLLRRLFKETVPALFSAILVLLTASNTTVLGLWFLVPMALGLMFLPMLLYFFVRALESRKHAFLFIFLFASATLFHPAYTISLIPGFVLFLALNPRKFASNQMRLAFGAIVLVLILPFFAFQLGFFGGGFSFSIESFKALSANLLSKLTFSSIYSWNPLFYFIDFLQPMLFFLGFFGFGFVLSLWALPKIFRKKSGLFGDEFFFRNQGILLVTVFAAMLVLYVQFHLFGVSFLAPYARLFMSELALLLMFAGIGFYVLLYAFRGFSSAEGGREEKLVKFSALAIAALFFSSQLVLVPFAFESHLYQDLEHEGIPALDFLMANSPENARVFALPWYSLVIRAYAERKIFATPLTRAGSGIAEDSMVFFLEQRCERKELHLQEFRPDFIFSEKEFKCGFADRLYSNGFFFVYGVAEG